MTCRITARFNNTESAQAAARAVKERVKDVYNIRLQYSQDIPNKVYINSINYTESGIMMHTSAPLYEYPTINAWPYGTANLISGEVSEECGVEIFADNGSLRRIRQIIVNNGGYDTSSEDVLQ